MCTVTIIPTGDVSFRLACNRDEARTRAAALPPKVHDLDAGQAIWPIDPEGGGTWIAVSDAGLVLVLLNRNIDPDPAPPASPRTRGEIIPDLIRCTTARDAANALMTMNTADFRLFRLVAVDLHEVLELIQGPEGIEQSPPRRTMDEPLLFTSSGIGDHLVDPPRRERFAAMLQSMTTDRRAAQHVFHQQRDPEHPELGVCMARCDAMTVSYTEVAVNDQAVTMNYHPAPPDEPAEDTIFQLSRCP